mmetsp:Transcript_5232/g.10194  ORF Transcript_5232/g.10194 Transcript_5232/m.10194 type:complete len:328 (+) Transcript_5232:35-1018(+)
MQSRVLIALCLAASAHASLIGAGPGSIRTPLAAPKSAFPAAPARRTSGLDRSIASIMPIHPITNKLLGVPITEATTFALSLLATAPGFNSFVHFFSTGYGLSMAAMASATMGSTMITTPAAMVHNFGCAVHGARLAHFVTNRPSWKSRDDRLKEIDAKFSTGKRAKVWVAYSALYALMFTPCLAHIRNPAFANSLVPAKVRGPMVAAGLAIQWAGIAIETVSDNAKQSHKKQLLEAKKKDTWLETGLYSKTRHPNYLGEAMVHAGSLLAGAPAMTGVLQAAGAALGTAGISFSLLASVKKYDAIAEKKYGKKYKEYMARTGGMLPKL